MIFISNKEIGVNEYTWLSVTNNGHLVNINNHNNLKINGYRLAVAMARTLCSKHLNNSEYWIDIISSYLSVSNLIASNSPNIRIKNNRIKQLRDFSRTNKIGEISQGIVWLYLQENDYPYINDFHFFCEQNNIVVPTPYSTPDFISQGSNKLNCYCLSESKGKEQKSSTKVKSALKKALRQCDSGELLLSGNGINISKKLGFCSEWAEDISTFDSKLHFVDPIKEFLNLKEDLKVVRNHYASWFYMIGDFTNSKRLINGENIILNESDFRIEIIKEEKFWVLNRLPNSIYKILKDYFNVKFLHFLNFYPFLRLHSSVGISQNVISFLSGNDEINLEPYENVSNESIDLFADGTIILKLRNE